MKDSNPQAILLRLSGGAAPVPAHAAPPVPARPQLIFFPISGATAPLKQN